MVDGTPDGSCEAAAARAEVELYAVKLTALGEGTTDWHWDLTAKGGGRVGGMAITDFNYQVVGGNFTIDESPFDTMFVVGTAPGLPGSFGCRVLLDASNSADAFMGLTTLQAPGETIDPVFDGFNGSGVRLMDGQLVIPLDRGMGAEPVTTPIGYSRGIEVFFGALIDFQPLSYLPMAECAFGGAVEHPTNPGHGIIHGYNIYRREDDGSGPPTAWTEADWLGYVPHHGFVLTTPTADPPEDDAARYLDADDVASNGNEYIRFNDTDDPSVARLSPLEPPELERTYWYGLQPTVDGDLFEWSADTEIARVRLGFNPVSGPNLDLDGDGSPEFFSPNASIGGLRGLGLTCGGEVGVIGVVQGRRNPLSATDAVSMKVEDGAIQLSVDGERADVLGYDVHRVQGARRTRLNDRLIPSLGGGSTVHRLVDVELQRRGRGSYEVVVHRSDGTREVLGTFDLVVSRRGSSRRG
ncbi:MAG: hypothetical protein AAF533_02890 [Acidobacteriota bacterium]